VNRAAAVQFSRIGQYRNRLLLCDAEAEVLTTATIVPDSPLGLPMDDIYRNELGQLRVAIKKSVKYPCWQATPRF